MASASVKIFDSKILILGVKYRIRKPILVGRKIDSDKLFALKKQFFNFLRIYSNFGRVFVKLISFETAGVLYIVESLLSIL